MNNVTVQTSAEVTKHFHIWSLALSLLTRSSLLPSTAINHNSKTALRQNLYKAKRQRYTRHPTHLLLSFYRHVERGTVWPHRGTLPTTAALTPHKDRSYGAAATAEEGDELGLIFFSKS